MLYHPLDTICIWTRSTKLRQNMSTCLRARARAPSWRGRRRRRETTFRSSTLRHPPSSFPINRVAFAYTYTHTHTPIYVYNTPSDKSFRVHFAVETSRTGSQRLLLYIYIYIHTFLGRRSIVLDVKSVQRRRWVMDSNIFISYIRRYKYLYAADRFARGRL